MSRRTPTTSPPSLASIPERDSLTGRLLPSNNSPLSNRPGYSHNSSVSSTPAYSPMTSNSTSSHVTRRRQMEVSSTTSSPGGDSSQTRAKIEEARQKLQRAVQITQTARLGQRENKANSDMLLQVQEALVSQKTKTKELKMELAQVQTALQQSEKSAASARLHHSAEKDALLERLRQAEDEIRKLLTANKMMEQQKNIHNHELQRMNDRIKQELEVIITCCQNNFRT